MPKYPPRGEQRFGSVTYSLLAEWTGLTVATLRSYSQRKVFDLADLNATLRWVNARRRRQGLPLIGEPDSDVTPDTEADKTRAQRVNPPRLPTVSNYNPLTGAFDD